MERMTLDERKALETGEVFFKLWLLDFFDEDGEPLEHPVRKSLGMYRTAKDAYNAIWDWRFGDGEGADGDFEITKYQVSDEYSKKVVGQKIALAVKTYIM